MKSRSCKFCIYHKAELLSVETDEDGERPILRHICTASSTQRVQPEAELEFGCGLFEEGRL